MKLLKKIMVTVVLSLLIVSCEKSDVNDIEAYDLSQETEMVVFSEKGETKEIKLDYHEKYGVVKATEFPMNARGFHEPTLEAFLEKTNLKKEDLASYEITKNEFSGVGLAEHRMKDGNVIQVPHRFSNEPVYEFKAETKEGKRVHGVIIIVCSNGLIIIIWY